MAGGSASPQRIQPQCPKNSGEVSKRRHGKWLIKPKCAGPRPPGEPVSDDLDSYKKAQKAAHLEGPLWMAPGREEGSEQRPGGAVS